MSYDLYLREWYKNSSLPHERMQYREAKMWADNREKQKKESKPITPLIIEPILPSSFSLDSLLNQDDKPKKFSWED